MLLQPGDRLLVKKIKGFRFIQEAICWKTNSAYSHIEPVTMADEMGVDSIDATFPRVKFGNIKQYFNGQWRVLVLRPVPEMTQIQRVVWVNKLLSFIGKKYDVRALLGFLANKPFQTEKKYTCSEILYYADYAVGLFPCWYKGEFTSPQTYYDFFIAGMFSVVYNSCSAPAQEKDYDFLVK